MTTMTETPILSCPPGARLFDISSADLRNETSITWLMPAVSLPRYVRCTPMWCARRAGAPRRGQHFGKLVGYAKLSPTAAPLLREYNRTHKNTNDERLRESVIHADPELSWQGLQAHRQQQTIVRAPDMDISGTKRRACIGGAKQPMALAIQKVLNDLEKFRPLRVRPIHYRLLNFRFLVHSGEAVPRGPSEGAPAAVGLPRAILRKIGADQAAIEIPEELTQTCFLRPSGLKKLILALISVDRNLRALTAIEGQTGGSIGNPR